MNIPKIVSATAVDDHTLVIQFDNSAKKLYNVTPLFGKAMLVPLKNPALFKSVKVEQGGYAVSWNNEIDISEYELWSHGEAIA